MNVPSPAVIAAAQGSQRKYAILASTSLGQWALESEWGRELTGAFNYFGVKAPNLAVPGRMCWTHEEVHGVRERMQCRFRDFVSEAAAFDYHGLLIATDRRYAAAYKARAELEAYVRALAPVYATAAGYADQLLGLIHDNRLTLYDLHPAGAAFTQAAASG